MRKAMLLCYLLFFFAVAAWSQQCPVIPQPLSSTAGKGSFTMTGSTSISSKSEHFDRLAEFLQKELLRHTGIAPGINLPGAGTSIVLEHRKKGEKEAYSIEMDPWRVRISAATEAGMFNGISTFLQLARTAEPREAGLAIACWDIEDAPYYAWRGVMLDESRHFYGMEVVKSILDWMAFYKLNRFHWHLTDTPGWRLEIRKYPKLTLVGGIGNHSNPLAPAAYYTQEEISEIVAYARERHIQVIPEIDMPGHAAAANRAYPAFSGGGSERYPEFTFNPGLDSTYGYLTDILRETDALFPSQMIHLGGDEVHFGNQQWNTDEHVQQLMKKEGLESLKEVELYFIRRMADSVIKLNNRVLGWDEIAGASLPADKTVIFWWRQEKPETLKEGLDNGYSVVLCPRLPLYFDFVQDSIHRSGRRWKGDIVSLQDVYAFSHRQVIPERGKRDQVLGLQANLWTETSKSRERLEFLLFPRISALSEAAWAGPDNKDFNGFTSRLEKHLELYGEAGIYYYNPFSPAAHPEVIR